MRTPDHGKIPATASEPIPADRLSNTFQLVTLASLRARQLQAGARPRVEIDGHGFTRVALLEVSAGLVSWSLTDTVRPPITEPVHGQSGTPR